MARVIPYSEQQEAQGINRSEATDRLTGVAIGRAVAGLGESIGAFGARQRAVEDDQAKMWAATATAEKEVELRKQIADKVNSLDPTAPDYADQIAGFTDWAHQQTDAATDDLMTRAPNDSARRYVDYHMASTKVRTLDAAMGTQADLNAAYTLQIANNGVKANTDVLAANPSNDTYADLIERTRQTVGSLDTIDPNTKIKLIDQAESTYANVQLASLVAHDPEGFLKTVNAEGGYTNSRGVPHGAVPTGAQAQPEMLAFANAQLDAGKSPVDALTTLMAKYPDQADKFTFAIPEGGNRFVDKGAAAGVPQVQPLDDQAIANANPGIAGWAKLTWPEKVKYVRQAEAALGKQMAEDRGALTRELRDASATLQAGQDYPGLNSPRYSEANLVRVFGQDEGGRAYRELRYDATVGQARQQIDVMPAAQRAATLDRLAPVGGTDFAAKQQAFGAVQEAAARAEREQQAAPIEYAITHGIGGAQPLDFSQPLAPQLSARVKVAQTMAGDYGTKAEIYTAQEVDQLANALGNMSGKDRIATLASIRVGLSDPRAFGVAMNQLAPKNPNLAYAGNLAARGGTAFVDGKPVAAADVAATIADGDIILNGRSLDKQMAKGDDPSMPGGSKATNFKEADFRTYFQQTLGGAFRTPDAQLSAATEQSVYNAVKAYYAADSYRQGKPLDQIDASGVKRAIEAVVGSPWQKNGGTLLAPYGMPVEQFQSQWNVRAEAAIKAAGYDDTATGRFLDRAVPVNLADGKYGFQVGTGLLADPKTGRKVIVDYSQPFTAPTQAQSPLARDFGAAFRSAMTQRY